MKKSEIKKLDALWAKLIRSKGECEIDGCNKSDCINAHHIVGRRNLSLRWDIRNGCCLCAGHHTFGKLSAHQDPEWFHDWLTENRPEDLEYLREQRNKVIKRTYNEVLEELNEQIYL